MAESSPENKEVVKQKVSIELFGHQYSFHSDASPERIKEIVDFFQSELDAVAQKGKDSSQYKSVILTGLNLSDKYYSLKQEFEEFKATVAKRSERALQLVDESLGASAEEVQRENQIKAEQDPQHAQE